MHIPRLAFCCFPILLAFSSARPAAQEAEDLHFFRDLVETRSYALGQPVSPQITPDGKAVIFLRGGARDPVLRLYEFTIADEKLREILSPEKLLQGAKESLSTEERSRRERSRQSLQGFTSFQLATDGSKLIVLLSGRMYLVARADARVTPLPGEDWIDPRFSPNGQFVAAVRGDELHVIDLEKLTDGTLTKGASETIQHGLAEFVAQEEMDRREGYWWSPDSQTLAYQETDNSGMESRFIADPLHPDSPPAKNFYPRAGTNNAKVRLGLIARSGGDTRWVQWDRAKFPYLTRVVWKEGAAPLSILVQDRAQQDERLLAVDSQTGATRELLKENDSAWLNLDPRPMPMWLKDGQSFLWTTERNGAWQLELHSANGSLLRAITPPDFGLDKVVGAVDSDRAVLVTGGKDARESQLFTFPLSAAGTERSLTSKGGWHDAEVSERKDLAIHHFDLLGGASGWEVMRVDDGAKVCALPSVAEHPSQLPALELIRTEGARPMDAAIVRPHHFEKDRSYPVILDVYAGPHGKEVVAVPNRYLIDQWMADRGYVVVAIDGRGTPGHGREWERAIRGNLIDLALEDQIAGLQALARREPALDLKRVGVVGWSFGGYFSAMATIRRPDIFRCGAAGAPVVTWENYDTYYTERYLGLPSQSPEAYRVSSVLTYAADLTRPLLIIHGLTDDNVYFQHSVQLMEALFTAGKPFEFLPLLGTHMVSDPVSRLRRQMRVMEFFDRELQPANSQSHAR